MSPSSYSSPTVGPIRNGPPASVSTQVWFFVSVADALQVMSGNSSAWRMLPPPIWPPIVKWNGALPVS